MREVSCLRPDGKWCEHDEDAHWMENGFAGGHLCAGCWKDDGNPLIGPSTHEYNPHILTEAGWLPVAALAGAREQDTA